MIVFAGGGTGGHIYPNLAVYEALRTGGADFEPLFVVSNRDIDANILQSQGLAFVALRAQPLYIGKPTTWPGFVAAYRASCRQMRDVFNHRDVRAVIATGGFVSGPAVAAAHRHGIASAMVNLDAVPGKANRRIAPHADRIFSVYETPTLPNAVRIGLPMRAVARGPADQAEACRLLQLDPARPTLMVTGGSQGAQSLNRTVTQLLAHPDVAPLVRNWQVLHICGANNEDEMRSAYAKLKVHAQVQPYCDRMGAAWRCAALAFSRAGAGSVAEAWANAVPTLFWPYPGHKDEHQRLNALPMVEAGGAILYRDTQQPQSNVQSVVEDFIRLVTNATERREMVGKLQATRPPDGATMVADWVLQWL